MIAVKALTSDGDWFTIPNKFVPNFERLVELIESTEGEEQHIYTEEFETLFSKYRTGGDLNNKQLYI